MAASRHSIRRHWAILTLTLISVGLVMGDPSRTTKIETDCDQNDLHGLLVVGSICGAKVTTTAVEDLCDCEITIVTSSLPPVTAGGPIRFEHNLGQAHSEYSFVSRLSSRATALLRSDEAAVLTRGSVIKAKFEGAREGAAAEPLEQQPGHINYMLGNDPDKWITDIPIYRSIKFREVYPGVDIQYYGQGDQLEHDFIVKPGADPSRIRFRFEGTKDISVNREGDVVLKAANGHQVFWKKPRIFQPRGTGKPPAPIEGRYRLAETGAVSFEVGAYNPNRPLVIDPIVFSTFVGASETDIAGRTAVDPSGNVYVTGRTNNLDYPVTPGLTPPVPNGPADSSVIISKYRPDGTGLVYSAIIGGTATDLGLGIAVDPAGSAYLTGYTTSGNFPTTAGALRRTPVGPNPDPYRRGDCFITKLNPAGNALVYSTYLSGGDIDACAGIAVDAGGNAYVAGVTASAEFPRTEQAFQQRYNVGGAGFEGFVAKLNPAGSALVYSSLLGGSSADAATGIAIDASGAAYVTGFTMSADLPVTVGSFQPRFRASIPPGSHDAFVVKVNPAGSALVYGTYLGGSGDDMAFGIAVDSQGAAVVCGNTMSTDFPVSSPSYQAAYRGAGGQTVTEIASGDAFVSKLNSAGSALAFSTYLGGSRDDRALACGLDSAGRVMMTGYTLSPDFPVTGDAAQPAFGGTGSKIAKSGDAFFVQLGPAADSLIYSTFLGGNADDVAIGLTVDGAGASYVAGTTGSENFLTTAGVFGAVFGGSGVGGQSKYPFGDGFLTKFGPAVAGGGGGGPTISSVQNSASYVGGSVSPGEIVVLTGSSIGPAQLTTAALATPDSLATLVAETRILFDNVPAPIIYVSAGQSAAVVPYGVAGRANTVIQAEYRGVRSASIPIPVISLKPALFTANASGRGPVAAFNQDNTLNSQVAAARGTVIALYGTGSGVTQPPSVDGRLSINVVPRIALSVSVSIAGITAEPLYAGAAPSLVAGVFQINVTIPSNAPSGNQPLVVRIGDASSQSGVTVAIQ